MTPQGFRAAYYNTVFPDRPPLASTMEWVTGTWCIGACYKNPNPLYGAYPYGYLERVHSMFPDARKALHAFSGGLFYGDAMKVAWPDLVTQHANGDVVYLTESGIEMELVDLHGPEQGRHPTWQGDVLNLPETWAARFDLIIADPPYSAADAEKYDVPMVNRRKVMAQLRRVAAPSANLVWLDQCWPQHRKDQWKTWGHVGVVRSTMHRMRLVSMFQAVEES